jgi:uncharacterized protein (TIGR00251 family)
VTKLEHTPEGWLRFHVRLTPRASRNAIAGWDLEGALKIMITAPPVNEAANTELIIFLARELGIRKNTVHIMSGHRSRKKRIEVPGTCKNRLLRFADI